ncbi:hypothetical protein [Devosia submarina]|uniref:hypothetical protein n=1 Tax=Devosia submarina TaxID=1173082 RepID=UPI0013006B67|nr:hypothetical protein [Devosia submarina]
MTTTLARVNNSSSAPVGKPYNLRSGGWSLAKSPIGFTAGTAIRNALGVSAPSAGDVSMPSPSHLNVVTYVHFSQKNGTIYGDGSESAFRTVSDAWRRRFQQISTAIAEYYPAVMTAVYKPDAFDYERDVFFSAPAVFGDVQAWSNAFASNSESNIVSEAHKQLDYLSQYEAGWNGPRSQAPSNNSFKFAKLFLSCISPGANLKEVAPLLFSNGHAVLEIRTNTASLRLEFTEDGAIFANVDQGETYLDLDLAGFSGAALPPELQRYL